MEGPNIEHSQNSIIEHAESILPPIRVENQVEGLSKMWVRTKDQVHALLKIGAFTMLVATATAEAGEKDSTKNEQQASSKSTTSMRGKVESRRSQDNSYESERMIDLKIVEALCKKSGFNIESSFFKGPSVHLPPEHVKKIIIHIGQIHAQGSYENVSQNVRTEVIQEQQEIFNLLKNAYKQTHIPLPCLQEGIVDQTEADKVAADAFSLEQSKALTMSVAASKQLIKDFVLFQLKHLNEFIQKNTEKKDQEITRHSILLDIVRSIEKNKERTDISSREKNRLNELEKELTQYVHSDLLHYQLGGAVIAARYGYVHLGPAEEEAVNNSVANTVFNELGIKPDPSLDIYDNINTLSKDKKQKAFELINKYAMSKARETPAIINAKEILKSNDVVVIDYGAAHDFSGVIEDQYAEGNMKDVALIKLDTRNFQLQSSARTKTK